VYNIYKQSKQKEGNMSGKEWNTYFLTLKQYRKNMLVKALDILNADPVFRRAFGSSFQELASILRYPLRE
jgi:hypothetical protein